MSEACLCPSFPRGTCDHGQCAAHEGGNAQTFGLVRLRLRANANPWTPGPRWPQPEEGDPWSQIVLELRPESHHGEPGGLTNHMGHVCTFSTCGWKTGGLRLAPALAVGGYGRGRGGASGTTLSTKAASEGSLPGGDSGPVSPSGTWESPPTSPLSSPAGPRRAQAGLGE